MKPLALVISLSLVPIAAGGALAHAEAPPCPPETRLDDGRCVAERIAELQRTTVAATLNPRAISEVAADVSIIDRSDMDRRVVADLRDLIRQEPGIAVTSMPGRYGQDGFSIRGLAGNRVRIELDGVPVSDAYSIGTLMSTGRNMVDLDSIRQVEIVRGPASSLYGSDALGGVVSYTTMQPQDLLRHGARHHLALKQQWTGVNRGSASTVTGAFGDAANGFLVSATHRRAHETDTMGRDPSRDARRTWPDPQQIEGNNLLAKYVHGADTDTQSFVTVDVKHAHVQSDVLSARNAVTQFLDGNDRSRRERISIGTDWNALDARLADRIDWRLWSQRSHIDQRSIERRRTGPGYERHAQGLFDQNTQGSKLHLFKHVTGRVVDHDFTYGLDATRSNAREIRDGYAINLTTGSISKGFLGGNAGDYPARDFPPSTTTTAAIFVQDEMHSADGAWRLIPGVRIDHYRFQPRADALFDSQPFATQVKRHVDHHVSPKLGAVWQINARYNAYAQYASGFRAPPYSDLGLLFTNLHYGFVNIPNPELQSETSDSLEFGFRGEGASGWFTLAAYANRYRNFIDSVHMLRRDQWPEWTASTPGLTFVFQSVNLTRARIHGFEASSVLRLGAMSDALDGWRIHANLNAARGDSRETDAGWEPLRSVDPARAMVGIGFDGARFGIALDATAVTRKNRLPADDIFRAPGYARLDLYANWSPSDALAFNLGINNITDRKYWEWGNLYGGFLGAVNDGASIDRYSAPGRNISVSARFTF